MNSQYTRRMNSATQKILNELKSGVTLNNEEMKQKYGLVNPYMAICILRKEGNNIVRDNNRKYRMLSHQCLM